MGAALRRVFGVSFVQLLEEFYAEIPPPPIHWV